MSSVHNINDKIIKTSNPYYKNNSTLFNEIVDLICQYPIAYGQKLSLSLNIKSINYLKYHHLSTWINEQLLILSTSKFKYSFSTKCYWILKGLVDFPICPICGKSDNYKNKNISIEHGYSYTCCSKCALQNPERGQRIRETTRKRLINDPDFLHNRHEKAKRTCLKRYGVENPSQSAEIKQKKANTCFQHYGVYHNFASKDIRDEIKETWKRNYGVEHISQSEHYKKSFKQTSQDRYGMDHPMYSNAVRIKCHQKYKYNNIFFDSSWELALYIYLIDHNINFEYQPDNPILFYEVDNKKHRYFPDFKINNQLFEIKGDHLIDQKTGIWIPPPYYKKLATKKQYDKMKLIVEAKYKCAMQNNVIILTFNKCKKYILYIETKYGKNYIKQFKYKKHN